MTRPRSAPRPLRQAGLGLLLLLGLGACATPVTKVEPTPDDTVYTASGRYPADHNGILIAQNAALTEGRAVCETGNRRFRPLASVAGEDPESGEAFFFVRFRCILGRVLQAPLPGAAPGTSGKM